MSWRNISRRKIYSVINILGLAIGLACFVLISLFIQHELSYDRFISDSENIFRVGYGGTIGANEFTIANSPIPVGPALKEDYPEIVDVVRMQKPDDEIHLKVGDQIFKETRFFYADSNFFTFFDFALKAGSPRSALKDPSSLVIAESQVNKYFGDESPLGKVIEMENGESYQIAAVAKDLPPNTHFHFNFIAALKINDENQVGNWFTNSVYTYIKTNGKVQPDSFAKKLEAFVAKHNGPGIEKIMGITYEQFLQSGNKIFYFFQPLKSIHLKSNLNNELEDNGDSTTVIVFAVIGLIVLIIAGINYINLSTARSVGRAGEVGIRKTFGARRNELIKQYLVESLSLTLLSMILALVMVELLLPGFNSIMGREVSLSLSSNYLMVPALLLIVIVVGLCAGLYPAFVLSSFQPVLVLKGKFKSSPQGRRLRNGLVIFQFCASIILFFATQNIYLQLSYMKNKNLGFNKDHIVVIHQAPQSKERQQSLKNLWRQSPEIQQITFSNGLPFHNIRAGVFQIEVAGQNESHALVEIGCDYDFQATYGIELKRGRFFSADMPTDSQAVVINEAAVKALSLGETLGHQILRARRSGTGDKFTIIGIMKDIHIESLQNPIRPMVLILRSPQDILFTSLRINSNRIQQTLEFIESSWKQIMPDKSFEFNFFDDRYNAMYEKEINSGKLLTGFSILAIFIASLGLFGLSAFTSEQRNREIGVRKVLGASAGQMILLLIKDYLIKLLIAGIIAFPVAWFTMNHWLETYTYRINLSVISFLMVILLATAIAVITVSAQTLKLALKNPVKVLRYE
jgi:putative ABC transport system permease protein